jgi:hypothetical protein
MLIFKIDNCSTIFFLYYFGYDCEPYYYYGYNVMEITESCYASYGYSYAYGCSVGTEPDVRFDGVMTK